MESAWRKYARQATVDGQVLDLVPLEESHRRKVEDFQDHLDADTIYLRYGGFVSAELRKSPSWLENQLNVDGKDRFSQGAFLNGCLIGVGSIYVSPAEKSAEGALVVSREYQGLGRGRENGVGGLLLEDLIRYARDQQLEKVTAHLTGRNPRCERLLRKFGIEVDSWSYVNQDGSAVLDLRQSQTLPLFDAGCLRHPPNSGSRRHPTNCSRATTLLQRGRCSPGKRRLVVCQTSEGTPSCERSSQ